MEDIQCQRSLFQISPENFKLDVYDYVIVSDASSYTDYISGHAALVLKFGSDGLIATRTVCGSNTMTETGRAEFNAALLGLHAACEMEKNSEKKLNVCILSDREDLVGSMRGTYKRRTNKDLWAAFSWYESMWNISAFHIKRSTFPIHNKADCLASELRIVLNDFLTASGIHDEAARLTV